jgi:hypothetical protein
VEILAEIVERLAVPVEDDRDGEAVVAGGG